MLSNEYFFNLLTKNGIDFFTGVPDSLLKDFLSYIEDNCDSTNHIICANEGNAIALATGYHLATGKTGMVYMQNSGLGNSVNPLTSLTDKEIYSIPVLLLIGWRGEPDKKDEPQHIKQGRITKNLLDVLEIPYSILPETEKEAETILKTSLMHLNKNNSPYAIVVKKGTFKPYKKRKIVSPYDLSREDAIRLVVDKLGSDDIIVSTTGKTSRELFEYREELKHGHEKDFLTVGSMGHCSQIALGVASSKPDRNVYCLDGDGAVIMHMGALAIIGAQSPKNFKHIVINNGAHCSVGGQATCGFQIDIPSIAKACGYNSVFKAQNADEIRKYLDMLIKSTGPALLEIRVKKGARENLGRPTTKPIDNKKAFMDFLKKR